MRRTSVLALAAAVALVGGTVALIAARGGAERSGSPASSARAPSVERAASADEPGVDAADVDALAAAERDARRFLASFLALISGEARAQALQAVAPRLRAELVAQGARVPPGQAERRPRLDRVSVVSEGTISALVTAQIKGSDGRSWPLVVHMQRTADGWVATRLGGA